MAFQNGENDTAVTRNHTSMSKAPGSQKCL
jgi:hypothetical protein